MPLSLLETDISSLRRDIGLGSALARLFAAAVYDVGPGQFDRFESGQQFPKERFQLHSGEIGVRAKVNADAKSEMLLSVRPFHIESEKIDEQLLVTVGRCLGPVNLRLHTNPVKRANRFSSPIQDGAVNFPIMAPAVRPLLGKTRYPRGAPPKMVG